MWHFIISSCLIVSMLSWLFIFLFCYYYYSLVDKNRINFRTWSIVSFLFMLSIGEMYLFLLTKEHLFRLDSNIFFNLILLKMSCAYLENKSVQIHVKPGTATAKCFRYSNIFLQILTFICIGFYFVHQNLYLMEFVILIYIVITITHRNFERTFFFATYLLFFLINIIIDYNIIAYVIFNIVILFISLFIVFKDYKKDKEESKIY